MPREISRSIQRITCAHTIQYNPKSGMDQSERMHILQNTTGHVFTNKKPVIIAVVLELLSAKGGGAVIMNSSAWHWQHTWTVSTCSPSFMYLSSLVKQIPHNYSSRHSYIMVNRVFIQPQSAQILGIQIRSSSFQCKSNNGIKAQLTVWCSIQSLSRQIMSD